MRKTNRSGRLILSAGACAVAGFGITLPVQAVTYDNHNGTGLWNDPLSWNTNLEPISTDTVTFGTGATVISLTGNGSFNVFSNAGTVNIDNGGNLTGAGNYSVRYATINVNNGGTFNAPAFNIRSIINVNTGGTMNGTIGVGIANDARTLTVAGTFSPRGTTLVSGLPFQVGGSVAGVMDVKATGKIVLDVYGNNSSEYFNVAGMTSATKLTFAAGSQIVLRPQGGYVPASNDSFDLWTLAGGSLATLDLGGVSSISIQGSSYALDTSTWATDGIVTVVPEPASLGLTGLAGVGLLVRRRRK